jgi:hypothetical protein
MRKLKRKKVILAVLESRIEKNQRRIAKLAEQNFEYRKQITAIAAIPKQTPLTKADLEARDKAVEEAEIAAKENVGIPPLEA